MEKNELLEIWKEIYTPKTNTPFWELRYDLGSLFWQLKAKMDDQKKQIIGFAKDNALLHQRLKKCQGDLEFEKREHFKLRVKIDNHEMNNQNRFHY